MRGFGRTLALMYRLLFYGRDHRLTVTLEVPVRVEVRREDPSQVRGPRLLLPAEKSSVQGASACTVTSEQRHRQAYRFSAPAGGDTIYPPGWVNTRVSLHADTHTCSL